MPLIDCQNTEWSFRRTVFDRLSKQQQIATGKAVITGNNFVESGLWTYPVFESSIIFNQSYRLDYSKPNVIQVCFNVTNEIFFELNLDGNQSLIKHVCGHDHYHGLFKISYKNNGTKFYLSWQVQGPRKDYMMKTIYKNVQTVRC